MIVASVRLLTLMRMRALSPAAAAVAAARIFSTSRCAQIERRDQELAEPRRPAEAGQVG